MSVIDQASFVYFEREEIIARLVGRRHPLELASSRPVTIKRQHAERDIAKYELFMPNDGKNGWLLPNGLFVPCNYQGHILLSFACGFENDYGKTQKGVYVNCDTVAEEKGWIKVSGGKAHILNRPTSKQKRMLDKLPLDSEEPTFPEESKWGTLSTPPNGYVSEPFDAPKFVKFRALAWS